MNHMQSTKIVGIVSPQVITDNTSPVGSLDSTPATVDTKGWGCVDIYLFIGATDIAMAQLEVHESDDDSVYAAVDGLDWATDSTIPSDSADNTFHCAHIKLDGKRKRYFQLEVDGGNGSAGAYFAAFAILSEPEVHPNTAAERGLASELFYP